jgi:hypothetical protein
MHNLLDIKFIKGLEVVLIDFPVDEIENSRGLALTFICMIFI